LRQRYGLIVKGKRISYPPHYAPPNNDYDPPHHDYEHGFPLIRSLRASARRSTSVLFSFVLSLLIVAGSFAIRQSKTILERFYGSLKSPLCSCVSITVPASWSQLPRQGRPKTLNKKQGDDFSWQAITPAGRLSGKQFSEDKKRMTIHNFRIAHETCKN
jgi:hypothetical protein